jgi:hypothetical protein
MIVRQGTPPDQLTGSLARAERILLLGALAMLLLSAALGDSAGAGGPGGTGQALIAHVHAGSLGWLTLAVLAVALRMARDRDRSDDRPEQPAGASPGAGAGVGGGQLGIGISWLTVVTVLVFVVATAERSSRAEAWLGAAALLAILGFLGWLAALSRRVRIRWAVPQFGMAGALSVLVAGTIIGAMSAGDSATGNATGAASLASAHSAVLVVPFVVLAATSVLEWAVPRSAHGNPPVTTAGLVQVGSLVLAAAAMLAGVLGGSLTLVEANIPLELGGIAIFLVRVGPLLLTAGWTTASRIWMVTSTVSLAVDVGLFAHVVFEIGTRRYVSIDLVPRWLLFTVDHVTFVAVGTTALFAAIAAMAAQAGEGDRWPRTDAPAAAGLVLGLAGMAAGIGAGSAAVEGAAATLLGISVLAAAVTAAVRTAAIGHAPARI